MSEQTAKAFDFDTLTLGEVATIEDLSGYGIGALNEGTPQGKFLAALYMVAKRRSGDPTYTFNQALGVGIKDAQTFLGLSDDTDDADEDDETAVPSAPVPDVPAYEVAVDEGKGETFGATVTE